MRESNLSTAQVLAAREMIRTFRSVQKGLPAGDKIREAAAALERDWLSYVERATSTGDPESGHCQLIPLPLPRPGVDR